MTIFINNERKVFQSVISLHDLVSQLGFEISKGIAVALNNMVIPKADWQKFLINENDKVTIIRATQGG